MFLIYLLVVCHQFFLLSSLVHDDDYIDIDSTSINLHQPSVTFDVLVIGFFVLADFKHFPKGLTFLQVFYSLVCFPTTNTVYKICANVRPRVQS